MKGGLASLLALAVGCTFAAALFAFGAQVFVIQSIYEGSGREVLILVARLAVLVVLALVLVFKGGWYGVLAAIGMTLAASYLVWLLLPASLGFASISDPEGYSERFANFQRPPYGTYAVFDIMSVGITAALAQGLRIMAHVDPEATPRD